MKGYIDMNSIVNAYNVALSGWVIPLAERQTVLETAEKLLLEDIVVKEIPYYETSNSAGGDTVYIGSEVMINGEQ